MDRRTFLTLVGSGTVSGIAGCGAVPPIQRASTDVTFTTCGFGEPACDEVGIPDDLSAVDGERAGRVVVTDAEQDRVAFVGATGGIGDPDCRETFLADVSFGDGTLRYTVGNETEIPFNGGCVQPLGLNYYRLAVTGLGELPSAVRVRQFNRNHRDEETFEFERTIRLSSDDLRHARLEPTDPDLDPAA